MFRCHPTRCPTSLGVLGALAITASCLGGPSRAPTEHRDSGAVAPSVPTAAPAPVPASATDEVRPAVLAGSWYPGSREALSKSIDSMIAAAGPALPVAGPAPMALILPHAGHRWSGPTAAVGYRTVAGRKFRRVFILAPNHRAFVRGAVVPSVDAFETPLGRVPVDAALLARLAASSDLVTVDDGPHRNEHAIEIQLPFIQRALAPGFQIVPMIVGQVTLSGARKLAALLRSEVGPNDLVITSSDYTHYGTNYSYVPFTEGVEAKLRELDMSAFKAIADLSADRLAAVKAKTGITVCGYHPILVLLSLLPGETRVKLLKYQTSGAITGEFDQSVSYLAIAFRGQGWNPESGAVDSSKGPLSESEQKAALGLVRSVLDSYVRTRKVPSIEDTGVALTPAFAEDRGAFVTLKIRGRLRGCIGTIWPVKSLRRALMDNTVNAASRDSRFRPVSADELSEIDVEVSVLTKPHPVAGPQDIVIGRHGVVLSKEGRRAVYLPQVAPEQGWDVEQTLTHLAVKAGLGPDDWRSGARFEVFEAQVFAEPERR